MLYWKSERVERIIVRAEVDPPVGHSHAREMGKRSNAVSARVQLLPAFGVQRLEPRVYRPFRALLRAK